MPSDSKMDAVAVAVSDQLVYEGRDIDDQSATMKSYGYVDKQSMTLFLTAVAKRLKDKNYTFQFDAKFAASTVTMEVGDLPGAIYDHTAQVVA
jgi:hypothetical protein